MVEQKDTPNADAARQQELAGSGTAMHRSVESVLNWFGMTAYRLRDLSQTNYELGILHAENGRLFDAMMRFRIAVWFNKRHVEAWYNLGVCQMGRGKRPQAIQAFREALKLDPRHEEARYMLSVMGAGGGATRMPASLVMRDFDVRAPSYDEESLGQYHYRAPDEAFEALQPCLPKPLPGEELEPSWHVLDLGCGTGLCGRLLKHDAARIVGVDVSQGMLDEAKQYRHAGRRLYDRLLHKDILVYLAEPLDEDPFDLALAVNVFPYILALDAVLEAIQQRLKPGGYCLFTTEAIAPPKGREAEPFLVQDIGRFSHPVAYLRALAEKQGWHVLDIKPIELYRNYPGTLCLWQKPTREEISAEFSKTS